MGDIELLAGQQELFPVQHQRSTIPRCGDCGRFLRAGCPCMNPRCYGEGEYSHIPANAIHAAASGLRCQHSNGRPEDCAHCIETAAGALDAAWPHILSTINPPKGTP
jgi:hypothetical protein